jgi:hypothetical protein
MFTFIAPILRHRFVAFAKYRLYRRNKKARTAAGLLGRVDRLGVSVPVALNTDGHMWDVTQCAVIEMHHHAIQRHPVDKVHAFVIGMLRRVHVLAMYPQQRRALFIRVRHKMVDVYHCFHF